MFCWKKFACEDAYYNYKALMLIDTHCHLNVMVKKDFDVPLQPSHFPAIADILDQAQAAWFL